MSGSGALGLASYRVAGFLAGPFVRRKLRARAPRGQGGERLAQLVYGERGRQVGERLRVCVCVCFVCFV